MDQPLTADLSFFGRVEALNLNWFSYDFLQRLVSERFIFSNSFLRVSDLYSIFYLGFYLSFISFFQLLINGSTFLYSLVILAGLTGTRQVLFFRDLLRLSRTFLI